MRILPAAVLLLLLRRLRDRRHRPHPRHQPDPKTLMAALEQRIAIVVADERSHIDPNGASR